MLAILGEHLDCVAVLIGKGISLDHTDNVNTTHSSPFLIRDQDGSTALIIACETNQPEIVKMLIHLGANPNIQNQVCSSSHLRHFTDSNVIERSLSFDDLLRAQLCSSRNFIDPPRGRTQLNHTNRELSPALSMSPFSSPSLFSEEVHSSHVCCTIWPREYCEALT
jgi:ankyrin repeat protein